MNARVAEAFAKWPTFHDMPDSNVEGRRVGVNGNPTEQKNYIEALYALALDSVPIGRYGDTVIGEPAPEPEEVQAKAPARRGRHLRAG